MTGLLIVLLLIAAIYTFFTKNKHYEKYKGFYNLPTPFWFPIIGNTYKLVNSNILICVNEFMREFGDHLVVYAPHRLYVTSIPGDMKILLSHPNVLEKSKEYNHLKIYLKHSLMLAPVEDWRRQRKIVSRSFKMKILESFVNDFYLKSQQLVKMIENNEFDKNDIYTLLREYTLDAFCEKKNNKDQNENLRDPNNLPVLDLLLQVSKEEKLTDEYIQEETILFASAATNTTAHTIAFTCLLLALHPEIQEKVYEEVTTVIGLNKEIDKSHLGSLKFTEMTINEVLRLCPVMPLIGRQATADIDLGDKTIPANTGIIFNFFYMHRDENIYPNPLVFDPYRFTPEEIAKRPDFSFLPFSGGPRNCIGFKYAMMLMKTTVANIVRKFRITTKHKSLEELTFISNVVMTTTEPLDYSFHLR